MLGFCAIVLTLFAWSAFAQSDEVPPNVKGEVREIRGEVRDIKGATLGVAGLLRDLNAKVSKTEIKFELAADVLFDFDKADLRKDAFPALEKAAKVIKEYPKAPVTIDGHTDAKGDEGYNQRLSERRAASVKAWLVKNGGVEGKRITGRGLGEAKPAVPNTKQDGSDDPEGRQKNRRVEITLKTG